MVAALHEAARLVEERWAAALVLPGVPCGGSASALAEKATTNAVAARATTRLWSGIRAAIDGRIASRRRPMRSSGHDARNGKRAVALVPGERRFALCRTATRGRRWTAQALSPRRLPNALSRLRVWRSTLRADVRLVRHDDVTVALVVRVAVAERDGRRRLELSWKPFMSLLFTVPNGSGVLVLRRSTSCTKPYFFAMRGGTPVVSGDHPVGVRHQPVADDREVRVVPEQVARRLRHRRDLALRLEVLHQLRVRA